MTRRTQEKIRKDTAKEICEDILNIFCENDPESDEQFVINAVCVSIIKTIMSKYFGS